MLLNHPWIKPLTKPATITEDAEGEDASEQDTLADATGRLNLSVGDQHAADAGSEDVVDAEVAAWVREALDRKRKESGTAEKQIGPKPALHAAPLDTVSPAASPPIMTAPPVVAAP
jgi:mitogen-activated protein kinase kinase